MLVLSGLVHQIISGDAAETAPETTTAFRGLFEQTGCRTQYNIRPPSGPRGTCTTDTHQARQYPVSVVTVMLGYSKTPVTHSTRYLSEQMDFKDTATQSVTTNHPNARSATSSKRKDLTPSQIEIQACPLTATIVNDYYWHLQYSAVETQTVSKLASNTAQLHSRTIHHSNTDSLDENAGDHFTRLCPISPAPHR
jgi:hypothetical protein